MTISNKILFFENNLFSLIKRYYFNNFENPEEVYGAFATHGHIDGYARFVNSNTIVYERFSRTVGDEDDLEEERRMKANLNDLRNARSPITGKAFKLIELPEAVDIQETISNHDFLEVRFCHILSYDTDRRAHV